MYLKNFRNIPELSIDFSPFTILVGENNIGKTNVLMAICAKIGTWNIYYFEIFCNLLIVAWANREISIHLFSNSAKRNN